MLCSSKQRRYDEVNTILENEDSKRWIEMMEQPKKVTIIDAQVRLVREVDSCIEHVRWFVDIDVLTSFVYNLKPSRNFLLGFFY